MEAPDQGGQQAADGGDLDGDQPLKILPVVLAEHTPMLIHGIEPAIQPLKHLLLPLLHPVQ